MANISAGPHLLGHAILVGWGLGIDNPADIAAGTLFITSTSTKLFWGHKDRGIQASAALSMAGIAVVTGPAIAAGDLWGIAAYVTTTAGLLYGFFGHWLDAKFSNSSSHLLRFVLGEPRKRLRDAFLIAKGPTVVVAILSKNWLLLAAQAVYAVGDVMLGASKVEARALRARHRYCLAFHGRSSPMRLAGWSAMQPMTWRR